MTIETLLRQLDQAAGLECAPPGLAARALRTRRRPMWRWAGLGVLVVGSTVAVVAARSSDGPVHDLYIPSGSMEPTLEIGGAALWDTRIIPQRDDVVVLDLPGTTDRTAKRIVALGGETVSCPAAADGTCAGLLVDGVPQAEPWTLGPTDPFAPVTVPAGDVFVLGDHRGGSSDSREWGPVELTSVHGVVVRSVDVAGHRHPIPGAPVHGDPGSDVDPQGDPPAAQAVPG
jgi:signal peptidase I